MSGVVLVILGALLCFWGIGSVRVGVPTAGFALGWFLSDLFGGSATTTLVVGLAVALGAWVVGALIFRLASFFLGAVTGAVVGAKLFFLLAGDGTSAVLSMVFIPAVALVAGLGAHHFRDRALLWLTASSGAALVLSGVATISGLDLTVLHRPDDGGGRGVALILWLLLTVVGWSVQRRVFAKRLRTRAA